MNLFISLIDKFNYYNINNNEVVDFTQIDTDTWNDVDKIRKLVEKVKTASCIITSKGVHQRVQWQSGYSDVLTWHTQNLAKAKILEECFNNTFKDIVKESDKEEIKQFILRNHFFIGAKRVSFDFSKSSLKMGSDINFQKKFYDFLEQVNSRLEKLYVQKESLNKADKKAVTILTCNAGGGHKAVANSIKSLIDNNEGYTATVLNIDEVANDALDEVTSGAVKTWQIFSKFRCQENNSIKADLFTDLRWELHQFIPNNSAHEINQKLNKLGTDVILNTIHHEVQWVSPLADLHCPVCFINTDYELPKQLERLQVGVSSEDFKVFTPIEYQNKADSIPIGYPIRPGFEVKATEIEKQEVKDKYGVQNNESLVVIQMGSLAMGLEKDVKTMIENTKKLKEKCHFVFLCSNNQLAIDAIQKIANSLPADSKAILHPIGIQNDIELSRLYQACNFVVGKPGGATSAEIAASGAYLLSYQALPWEVPNLTYLQNRNQAQVIKNYNELVKILNQKECYPKEKEYEPVLDWKSNIVKEIDKIMQNKKHEFKVKRPLSTSKFKNIFIRHFAKVVESKESFFNFIKFTFANIANNSTSTFSALRNLSTRISKFWKYN